MSNYDTQQETLDHIGLVQRNIVQAITNLHDRAVRHDQSKLVDPEKTLLDALGSQMNQPPYGSPEERQRFHNLAEFRVHHYAHNDHHPEHTEAGFQGMSLMALLEMVCDWKAANARHTGGTMANSLSFNRARFNMSDELFAILENTVKELGWE